MWVSRDRFNQKVWELESRIGMLQSQIDNLTKNTYEGRSFTQALLDHFKLKAKRVEHSAHWEIGK